MEIVRDWGLRGTIFSAEGSSCERPRVRWGGEEAEAGAAAVGEVSAKGSHLRSRSLTNKNARLSELQALLE